MAEDLKIPQSELTAKATAFVEKFVADGRPESYIRRLRRYIKTFTEYIEGKTLTKTLVKEWALSLNEKAIEPHEVLNYIYAANGLLDFLGCPECKISKRNDFSFDKNKMLYLYESTPFDLTGQRFGRLVAVKSIYDGTGRKKWLCKCDCGNEKIIPTGHLTSGSTKSCGCLQKEKTPDLRGKRFGKLTVLRKAEEKNPHGTMWECLCDCGNKCLKPTAELTRGNTKSCGCAWRASTVVAGQRFGRLTAIEPLERRSKSKAVYWRCVCDCGNETEVEAGVLVYGHTTSCGCWFRESNAIKIKKVLDFVDSTCVQFLENIGNPKATTSPDTGVRGVTLQKSGKYQAVIFFRRQRYYLGLYSNLDDAVKIRKAAEVLVEECLEDYKNGIPFPDKLPVEKIYKD